MATAVIMPKYEMTQETGTVGAWLKAEGEFVRKGEVILEIETDKVSMDVESPANGILVGISAKPGQVVPVGQPIAYLLREDETWPDGANQPALTPTQPEPETSSAPSSAVAASPLATRMATGLGIDLNGVPGTGPRGKVTRKDIENHIQVAAPPAAGQNAVVSDPSHGETSLVSTSDDDTKVRTVPAARRLARELAVDLKQVRGTGPEGRIQSGDVRAYAEERAQHTAARPVFAQTPAVPALTEGGSTATEAEPKPAPVGAPAVRRMIPLTSIRRTIADRMTASVREAPQFTVSVDADMTRALAVVEDLKAGAAAELPRITLTTLLIRVCAWSLARHPEANSAFIDGQIAEWDEVNVGVATAIDAGLIVSVVRGADRLGMRAIAAQLADLTARAREGRLKLEDLQGGTFTLSNLGMFGIDRFTAILNPPQAAILAVGRTAKRAVVVDDDRIAVRPVSTLTLTADHRVLDGASAARFLATIQRALEHPGVMME